MNHTKNRTPSHVFTSLFFFYMQYAHYMLLFLVSVNSDWFKIVHAFTQAARSYALLFKDNPSLVPTARE